MKLNINPVTWTWRLFSSKIFFSSIQKYILKACEWMSWIRMSRPEKFWKNNLWGGRLLLDTRISFWEAVLSRCERQVVKDYRTRLLYQRLTKNLMAFAGAKRILALKKFRNSPSQMFCKIVFSGKHLCWSHLLMQLQA